MLTLASMGRFHFLEQARALAQGEVLDRFYCDDPRVLSQVGVRRGRWLAHAGLAVRRGRAGLAWRGEELARVTAGVPLVKINSAFACETLRQGRAERVWVDHGSLDERYVARQMQQEAEAWGDPLAAAGGNHSSPEILDRQAEEFARAEGVVVASELARQSLVGQGVPASKVRSVPLGVDSDRFRPDWREREPDWRERQPDWRERQPGRRFRILHAGPVTFNKGVHRLLDAFGRMARPECELWIAGPAPPGAGIDRLRHQAERLASRESVKFLGPVAQSRLPRLFAECDLFVLASLADGFGLTVLQGMSCGLPVVVTSQAGCAEVLAGCPAVEIVPAGQSEQLAAALERQFQRWERREELGPVARSWVRQLSWEQHAERLMTALKSEKS